MKKFTKVMMVLIAVLMLVGVKGTAFADYFAISENTAAVNSTLEVDWEQNTITLTEFSTTAVGALAKLETNALKPDDTIDGSAGVSIQSTATNSADGIVTAKATFTMVTPDDVTAADTLLDVQSSVSAFGVSTSSVHTSDLEERGEVHTYSSINAGAVSSIQNINMAGGSIIGTSLTESIFNTLSVGSGVDISSSWSPIGATGITATP